MFRALAGYIFGGTEEEDAASRQQVECNTKEVNDWLVVNVADHPVKVDDLRDLIMEENVDMEVEDIATPAPVCTWLGPKDLLFEESIFEDFSAYPDTQVISPQVLKESQLEEQSLRATKVQISPCRKTPIMHKKHLNTKNRRGKLPILPNSRDTCKEVLEEMSSNNENFHSDEKSLVELAQVKRSNKTYKNKPSNYKKLTSRSKGITLSDEAFPALPAAELTCAIISPKNCRKGEMIPMHLVPSCDPKGNSCLPKTYAQALKNSTEGEHIVKDKVGLLLDITNELKQRFESAVEFSRKKRNNPVLNKEGLHEDEKAQKIKGAIQLKMKEKSSKKKATKTSVTACNPLYSEARVNNCPSALAEILQRIKELEPEQDVMQQVLKKSITRGKLNRHNKTYLYDTSAKKNRRKDLQRNPSGANNNRKC